MRLDIILGLARAEARLLRRLVRFWVFVVLGWLIGGLVFLQYTFIHALGSSFSASVGAIRPKYLVSGFGFMYLAILLIGSVFMAFDVRARDVRERISEVLDCRPFSNLELVVGRFLGVLLQVWWPLVLFCLVAQGLASLAIAMELPIGGTVEWRSLVGYAVPIALPAFAFVLAFVVLVSILSRHRLVTALIVLAVLGGWGWLFFTASVDSLMSIDFIGTSTLRIPSELLTAVWAPYGLLQRLAVLLAAAGFLGIAAAAHPRPDDDDRRKVWAGVGVGLLVLAGVGIATVHLDTLADREVLSVWQAAHEARRDEPVADLVAVRGKVEITTEPSLTAEVELDVAAAQDTGLERVLFTLNPGLEVSSVEGGTFTHENGLLEVTLETPLGPGEQATLTLAYAGAPDIRFAYLDAPINAWSMPQTEAGNFLLFGGYEAAILDSRFVVLTAGIHWLPATGTDVEPGEGERARDFYDLTLDVVAPDDWLVAGPGRREETSDGYHFAPGAPLSEATLVASRFESRSIEVEGVELELLLSPGHLKNLEVFAEAGEEIRTWLEERFREAAEIGLDYPYGALTLVEVPGTLRGYGGGWRMDTALAPPGMVLMREWGFPTSRFDNRFRDPDDFKDRDGGIARAKRQVLEDFFESDFSGSNPFLGAARSFFSHQTTTHGPGSLALDFVCYELVSRLTSGKQGYFSVHILGQKEFQATIQEVMAGVGGGANLSEIVRHGVAQRPEVWDQALGVSLADMDPRQDPAKAVNVLVLKAGAMSRWMLDGLGREQTGQLISTLRSRHSGASFDAADLEAAATELGIDLGGLAGDWLQTTDLPGFLVSEAHYVRLEDSEDGVPRYQVALHLRNDEAAPGLVRLRYSLDDGSDGGGSGGGGGRRDRRQWEMGDPVRVGPGETVEVGLVSSKPLAGLRVSPYLALNREDFEVRLPTLAEEELSQDEPFSGTRPSDWQPATASMIVVDDLDSGFRVEAEETDSGFRLASRFQPPESFDQGLPVLLNRRPSKKWSRRTQAQAWGKYRHTQAVIQAGEGRQKAIFSAELPRATRWKLELYVEPERRARGRWKPGTYHLSLVDSYDDVQEVIFDAAAAEEGWNVLGEFELAAGTAEVVFSDETDGGVVVADAIRWQSVDHQQTEEAVDD
jgi:hypothetical protein